VLRSEVGAEECLALLDGAWLSSVKLAEVLAKLDDLKMDSLPRVEELLSLLAGVHPFTERQARIAASLRTSTRAAGLSLGDRACIALAIELDADVYTADRAWANVKLPCRVHLIR
jgi:ribonuclease VapC